MGMPEGAGSSNPFKSQGYFDKGCNWKFFLAVGKEKMDTLYPFSDIHMDTKYSVF
jgi:hypothetical protein